MLQVAVEAAVQVAVEAAPSQEDGGRQHHGRDTGAVQRSAGQCSAVWALQGQGTSLDSQKHIDFCLKSAFGGVRPGRIKKKNAKKGDNVGEDEAED